MRNLNSNAVVHCEHVDGGMQILAHPVSSIACENFGQNIKCCVTFMILMSQVTLIV